MLVLQSAHGVVLATVGAEQYRLKCPCNTEDVSLSCNTVFQSTFKWNWASYGLRKYMSRAFDFVTYLAVCAVCGHGSIL